MRIKTPNRKMMFLMMINRTKNMTYPKMKSKNKKLKHVKEKMIL